MYKRIVLKLSGEALAGERGFGLDAERVAEITGELAEIHALGATGCGCSPTTCAPMAWKPRDDDHHQVARGPATGHPAPH